MTVEYQHIGKASIPMPYSPLKEVENTLKSYLLLMLLVVVEVVVVVVVVVVFTHLENTWQILGIYRTVFKHNYIY